MSPFLWVPAAVALAALLQWKAIPPTSSCEDEELLMKKVGKR